MAVKAKKAEKKSLLKAAEGAAIAKAVKEMAEATSTIKPGEYDVDVTVRVKGTVKKGHDHPTTVTPKLLTLDNLLLALSKVNDETRRTILREMVEAYKLTVQTNTSNTPDAAKRVKALEARVKKIKREAEVGLEKAKISVSATATGATTVKLDTVEVVK